MNVLFVSRLRGRGVPLTQERLCAECEIAGHIGRGCGMRAGIADLVTMLACVRLPWLGAHGVRQLPSTRFVNEIDQDVDWFDVLELCRQLACAHTDILPVTSLQDHIVGTCTSDLPPRISSSLK